MSNSNRNLLVLNIVTIGGLVAYVIGIYLRVIVLGESWGNILVVETTALAGPILGIILVFIIYAFVVFLTFRLRVFQGLNLFLCWFWILSWYQCAINEFLYFYGLPNEPINLFFKTTLPTLWYPAKEIVFTSVSIAVAIVGSRAFLNRKLNKIDYILIGLVGGGMLSAVLLSQIWYINQ